MKSTTGAHFIALDHVRALAAFMVFTWHFTHGKNGYPIPFEFLPPLTAAPLALLDEGHTGVSLFMTLSGYLFAKLLDGKKIIYRAFLWNRALRLLPLLVVIIVIDGVQDRLQGGSGLLYIVATLDGLIFPTLPNGGWSVTVEAHFYLALPLLLWLLRKSVLLPLALIVFAFSLRLSIYLSVGEVQSAAYWTIIGRIDQFVLGMLAFQFRDKFKNNHLLAGSILCSFILIYWQFDRLGGFYNFPKYPSVSPIWLILPTVEGLAYASLIAWYEGSFALKTTGISRFVGLFGTYSYSIYLLHVFWVFDAPIVIETYVMPLSSYYVACLWALICFFLMMPVGYLSYRLIEAPFLGLRIPYIKPTAD